MKKWLVVVVLFLAVWMLGGCKKEEALKDLALDEIFTQEGTYFVYFYRDGCADCEQIKPIILSYIEILKSDPEEYEGKSMIYAVNLSVEENEKIFRVYSNSRLQWGTGQGAELNFWVDGVTEADNLYIASTSSLISIGPNAEDDIIAQFEAQGYDAIYQRLAQHLNLPLEEAQQ